MPLEGTVKIPGIGPVPKKGAVYGTAAIIVIGGGIWLYRRRHPPGPAAAAAAGAPGTVTDPAGNTCSALNPATGFCPGTPEDMNAQQGGAFNTSQLGTGLSGYYYGTGGAVQAAAPGPGNFADNAEWSQYVISYMTQNLGANPGALGDALGLYLAGHGVDENQNKLIEEAIATGGKPPQAGTGGYPPSIRLEVTHKPPSKKVRVPNVAGQQYAAAREAVQDAGLKARAVPRGVGIVAYEVPRPGREVDRGSTVTLHMAATG